jgi:REP element-mobilizing transposase RayT
MGNNAANGCALRLGRTLAQQRFRQSLRLREYDYGQPGYYYVTIGTVDRVCILGEVRACEMLLSELGEIVKEAWLDLPAHHSMVQLDEMVIMPNHLHGILSICTDENGMPIGQVTPMSSPSRAKRGPGKNTLSSVVGSLKSASSRNINKLRNTPGAPVWQAHYYEHIIRNEQSLDRIRAYISGNPARWDDDEENPYRR